MVPKSTGTCLPKMNRRSLTLAEAPEKSLNSTFLIHPRLSSYLLGSERKEVCFRSTLDFFSPTRSFRAKSPEDRAQPKCGKVKRDNNASDGNGYTCCVRSPGVTWAGPVGSAGMAKVCDRTQVTGSFYSYH